MTTIEPRHRHPLHSTAAILEEAFKDIAESKVKVTSQKSAPTLRPIMIYGLSDALAAIQAAAETHTSEITLMSPPGVAHSLGPQWFSALIRQAQASTEEIKITGILDCGHYEGHVMLALQSGLGAVYYTGPAEAADKLTLLAGRYGATLHRQFAETLDLKKQGDQLTACREWLSGKTSKIPAQLSSSSA